MKIVAKVKQKPVRDIFIETEFIRLDSALKLADAVQSGGHAKVIIQNGEVKVNGETCELRGKKLHVGDEIGLSRLIIRVNQK